MYAITTKDQSVFWFVSQSRHMSDALVYAGGGRYHLLVAAMELYK